MQNCVTNAERSKKKKKRKFTATCDSLVRTSQYTLHLLSRTPWQCDERILLQRQLIRSLVIGHKFVNPSSRSTDRLVIKRRRVVRLPKTTIVGEGNVEKKEHKELDKTSSLSDFRSELKTVCFQGHKCEIQLKPSGSRSYSFIFYLDVCTINIQ